MAKLSVLVTLFFTSSIASAYDTSSADYRAGYEAGLAQCQPAQTAFLCSAEPSMRFGWETATGRTAAEAILKIDPWHINALKSEGKTVNCMSLTN